MTETVEREFSAIVKYFDGKIDWIDISKYQSLSEDFIREFQDKVNWKWISKYSNLSEDFILEFKNKVNWNAIMIIEFPNLTKEFTMEFKSKTGEERIRQLLQMRDLIKISNNH
jgi:hypothetical protein